MLNSDKSHLFFDILVFYNLRQKTEEEVTCMKICLLFSSNCLTTGNLALSYR